MVWIAPATNMAFRAISQDSLLSVLVHRVQVISSTYFHGVGYSYSRLLDMGGEPCEKTLEATAAESHLVRLAHLAGNVTRPLVLYRTPLTDDGAEQFQCNLAAHFRY